MNPFFVSLENVKNTLMNVHLNQSLIFLSTQIDYYKQLKQILIVVVLQINLINATMEPVESKLLIVLSIKDVTTLTLLIDVYQVSVPQMKKYVNLSMLIWCLVLKENQDVWMVSVEQYAPHISDVLSDFLCNVPMDSVEPLMETVLENQDVPYSSLSDVLITPVWIRLTLVNLLLELILLNNCS